MTDNPHDPQKITDTTEISNIQDDARKFLREQEQDGSAAHEDENGNVTTDLALEARRGLGFLAGDLKTVPAGQAHFDSATRLELEVMDSGERVQYAVERDLVVGRGDNLSEYLPDVDLTPFGAYRLGLSRRHAILRRENETLIVQDLNSRNGTHVNETQVASGGIQLLRDGDQLRFGNLALRVVFKKV